MIYFRYSDAKQEVRIPRGVPVPAEASLTLSLRSTVGLGVRWQGEVADKGTDALNWVFDVALTADPDAAAPIQEGEYEYRLDADGVSIATGVAVIGGYDATRTEFDKPIIYEQYDITE